MKKLFAAMALVAVAILASCSASVRTPKTNTDIKVGTTEQPHK